MPPKKNGEKIPKNQQYTFTLKNINIDGIIKKYEFEIPNPTQKNTTKIAELIEKPEILSFYNESKKNIVCTTSMIDYYTQESFESKIQNREKYRCWQDHHTLLENTYPIGCPITYVFDKVTKKYTSEISKNKYSIIEEITPKKEILDNEMKENNNLSFDDSMNIEKNSYYVTEGAFCSFNCVQAYINNNKRNPLYKNSQELLFKLYKDIFNKEITEIIPAPDYKMLKEYGGKLTIDQYRKSFNKIEYIDRNIINMYSITRIYEEKYLL